MLDPATLAGGTEAPGVPDVLFAMPEGSAMRYDRPAAAIADFITGYHLYAAYGPASQNKVDWFLPGTANIRVTLNAGRAAVRVGRRDHDPLPTVALFGPTTHAMRAVTNGGVMIGFGISALGWARLFGRDASAVRDRIVPLEQLTGPELPARLVDILSALPEEHALKATLDDVLAPLVADPHPDEPLIRGMMAVLVDPAVTEVAAAAERLGVSPNALRQASSRHFGMSPKLLLRRARFLRSFMRIFRAEDDPGYSRIDRSYFDVSHFLRDADRFLGMTPRRFSKLSTPFLDGSVRARAAVLGHATQALHDIQDAPAKAG